MNLKSLKNYLEKSKIVLFLCISILERKFFSMKLVQISECINSDAIPLKIVSKAFFIF